MSDAGDASAWYAAAMERPEVLEAAGGLAAVVSAPSPAKTTDNEDAAAVVALAPDRALLAVADGVGGLAGGRQAAETALRVLATRFADGGDREAILDGFEQANRAVLEAGAGATTLAVVEIRAGTARSYHVGDSMILVTGQRGRVKMQAIAHSPVGYAVESGMLDAWDALHHEDRHLIDNVIGSADMRIEIGPSIALAPRDTVVLASDGLADNLHPQEIVERARRGPIARSAARLFDDARRRMTDPQDGAPSKPDDLTVLLFRPGGR